MSPEFTREQIVLLNGAHPATASTQRRVKALRLLAQGLQVQVVALRVGVTAKTVYQWFHAFQRQGLQALVDPIQKDVAAVDEGYRRCLEQTLVNPTQPWSVERLRRQLYEQTGIMLSERRLVALLEALGYRYRHVVWGVDGELVFVGSTWCKAPSGSATIDDADRSDRTTRVHQDALAGVSVKPV